MSEATPPNKPRAQRIVRELTCAERKQLERARQEVTANKAAILAEGRLRKLAMKKVAGELKELMGIVKSRRETLGLSLADVEARTGIKKSALSRLENGKEDANPTLLTLQRYALALGLTIDISARPIKP